MIDEKVVSWVKDELSRYSETEIKNYLLKRGMDPAQVDEALILAKKDIPDTSVQTNSTEGVKEPVKEILQSQNDTQEKSEPHKNIVQKKTEEKSKEIENTIKKGQEVAQRGAVIAKGLIPKNINQFEKYRKYLPILGILLIIMIIAIIAMSLIESTGTNISANTGTNPINTGNNLDSGYVGDDIDEDKILIECMDVGCFDGRFSECKPASITETVDGGNVFYYEVKEPSVGLCEVMIIYKVNDDKTLENKGMICAFDNTKKFSKVKDDISSCSGQLADALKTAAEKGEPENNDNALKGDDKTSTSIKASIDVKYDDIYSGVNVDIINSTVSYENGPVRLYLIQGYDKDEPDPVSVRGIVSIYNSYRDSETISFVYPQRKFEIADLGKYIFYVHIYNCTEIEKLSGGRSCNTMNKDTVSNITSPIAVDELRIEVKRAVLPICMMDSDCGECANCRSGSQKCVARSIPENRTMEYVCVDCISGYILCADGFECIRNECVAE